MPKGKRIIYNCQTGELREEEVDLDLILNDELNVIVDKTRIKADGVDTAKFTISFNKSWKITDKRCLITIIKDEATLTSSYIDLTEDSANYLLYSNFEFVSEVEGFYTIKFTLGSFEKIMEIEAYA
ncbi:MAG: hypothetical protein QXG39_07815 [Candidatus Aenigmatarchaeota archaeon]